jgi:DNA-binding PadR family transcriptional regulator
VATGLTEFESCVLATVRQHAPCSAYEVRQIFAQSSTPSWSGSSGSVYPAVERLRRQGFVDGAAEAGDRRGRKNLTVTPAGEHAIKSWIATLEPWTAKATPDPIRTRTSFLEQLTSDSERVDFLVRAEMLTKKMLGDLKLELGADPEGSRAEYAAGLGAIYQLEARLKWLRKVRRLVQAVSPSRISSA